MQLTNLPNKILRCGKRSLDLSVPHVMGILNVTPDSFSDGGQYHEQTRAIAHAKKMIEDGASVIDVGGESTRPGASIVEIEEEIRRVVPVVKALAELDIIISVDTSQPEVIRAAVNAGAHIWNDVRALTRPQALETAAELDIPVVIMHMRGEPTTMNGLDQYQDLMQELMAELSQRIQDAIQAGVRRENIVLDPGFGFAKNAKQNLQLLKQFHQLNQLGFPLLSGLSRKRFIGEALGGVEPEARVVGSVVGHLLSIQQGASIVRAHDVKVTHDAIQLWNAVSSVD